jgi:hypothetical protein
MASHTSASAFAPGHRQRGPGLLALMLLGR